jgi:hypothetical protein
MRMVRALTILGLLIPPAGAAAAQDQPPEFQWKGPLIYFGLDTARTAALYRAPPGVVYHALLAVYLELRIPVMLDDSATGRLGNLGSSLRRLGGKRMSAWVNCGEGLTGSNADLHKVTIATVSWVQELGPDSAAVRTGVLASSYDPAEGSSRRQQRCDTTGRLEELIHTRVRERLSPTGSR